MQYNAHSKNGKFIFSSSRPNLANAQILVSCEAPFRSNSKGHWTSGPVRVMTLILLCAGPLKYNLCKLIETLKDRSEKKCNSLVGEIAGWIHVFLGEGHLNYRLFAKIPKKFPCAMPIFPHFAYKTSRRRGNNVENYSSLGC